jgi:uncharacterized membrane protein
MGWLVFLFGFGIQVNALVGGDGEGAAAVGGYGFRLTDFLAVGAVGLLIIHSLAPRRILSLAIFAMIVGVVAVLRLLDPLFWNDPRTTLILVHYLGYSFAGLYIAIALTSVTAADRFCWGLIVGMLSTVPIFVLQDLGYTSTLVAFGLVPAYSNVLYYATSDAVRYAGLWVHPNEASHVAALSAAAGAYFAFVHRRFVPLVLTAIGLLVVFYYTQSRGGLLVAGVVLGIPLVAGQQRRLNILHAAFGVCLIAISILLISQLNIVAYRFTADEVSSQNFYERIGSTIAGLQLVLSNPWGLSDSDFLGAMGAATGGVGSPHNGFIYFAAIFGLLPFSILIAAFAANLRHWRNEDAYFALATLQVCLSFMFEEMPLSICYIFVICLLMGHAYLRTRIGHELIVGQLGAISGRSSAAPHPRSG